MACPRAACRTAHRHFFNICLLSTQMPCCLRTCSEALSGQRETSMTPSELLYLAAFQGIFFCSPTFVHQAVTHAELSSNYRDLLIQGWDRHLCLVHLTLGLWTTQCFCQVQELASDKARANLEHRTEFILGSRLTWSRGSSSPDGAENKIILER